MGGAAVRGGRPSYDGPVLIACALGAGDRFAVGSQAASCRGAEDGEHRFCRDRGRQAMRARQHNSFTLNPG